MHAHYKGNNAKAHEHGGTATIGIKFTRRDFVALTGLAATGAGQAKGKVRVRLSGRPLGLLPVSG